MAKKGKKSKMVHISKLHKNHPYVKAVRTRTTVGYVVLALILLGIIGVIIWGFVTNWGAGQGKDNYSCSSCTRYSTQDVEDSSEEKFTSDHCGKHLAGQCTGGFDVSEKFTSDHCGKHLAGQCTGGFDEVPESYCCGRPTLPTYGEEFDAGVF
jgi:hypothetical protein